MLGGFGGLGNDLAGFCRGGYRIVLRRQILLVVCLANSG